MLHSEIPHEHTGISALLCSPGLVSSPQVVDVHDESSFVLADHVPDFTLVNSLVLLQNKGDGDISYLIFEYNLIPKSLSFIGGC